MLIQLYLQKKYSLFFGLIFIFTLLINIIISLTLFANLPSNPQKRTIPQVQHASKNKKENETTTLSATQTGGSNVWSNAFNFKKTAGAAVDPRTGILSVHIKAGSLLSNYGHGPNIDLEAGYSSNAQADPDHLGRGWSWNLTHFNPQNNQLNISSGQRFYLKQKDNGQWLPLYHKLNDIRIDGSKKTHFIITYANGLRETLNHEGYEVLLEQQDGWCVHFTYINGTHLLQSIKDDKGNNITLHYKKHRITVVNKDSAGQPVYVLINKENHEVLSITVPAQNDHIQKTVYMSYTGHLINEMDYPTGMKKRFFYNCSDAMKITSSNIHANNALCVITKETLFPGSKTHEMTMRYKYSRVSHNGNNYLGFNSGLSAMESSYHDILFEAPVSYTYRTEEDNGIFREIYTYNKYHLMIDRLRISDRTGEKLSEVQTFFCDTNERNGCAHTSFDNLPLTYSQPLKIITKLWGNDSEKPAISKEIMSYDDHGRIVSHKDVYGRFTKIQYCPDEGDNACPAIPQGWLVNALAESVTVCPAKTGAEKTLPKMITQSYYRKLPNHTGNGYMLVLDHQVKHVAQQNRITFRWYYQNPADTFTYGLLKKAMLTGSHPKSSALTSIVKHYYYTKSTDNRTKTSYSAIESGPGKRILSSFITTSLFTNHVLQATDSTGNNIARYHYDTEGRLIQTDYSPGTIFAATEYYQYTLSPTLNQVIATAINGLQQKIIFDGSGRTLMRFREAIDEAGKPMPGHWLPISRITYDAWGRVAATKHYMIEKSGKTETLTTTPYYDDSGRVVQVHLPDKTETVTAYDDSDRCVINYRQSSTGRRSAISMVRANVLYQPATHILLPASETPLPPVHVLCSASDKELSTQGARISVISYDGFGRMVTAIDSVGRIVKKRYNALGQVTDITDPVGDVLHRVYDLAGHVIQSWALPAAGGHYLLSSAEFNGAGQLLWSAGEDGRRTMFTYTADGKLSGTTTPAGHTFITHYNSPGLPIDMWVDGKRQLQAHYDPTTFLVTEKTDNTGKTTFSYGTDGLIRQLNHFGNNSYPSYQLKWQYDSNQRIVSMTDVGGNRTLTAYDTLGRIAKISYQPHNGVSEMLSMPVYDDFSRIKILHYGSTMKRTMRYDAFGHVLKVTDILAGKQLSEWTFGYDINDNITTLINQGKAGEYARLNYRYDALNNLVTMTCSGSAQLPLCPRDTALSGSGINSASVITRQDYTFTPLNRLATVREKLQNPLKQQTLSKVVTYDYSNISAPLRLQKISTQWNHKTPATNDFDYDTAGNMITDGEGNHMLYNPFNQITEVTKTDGQHTYYHYNGMGQEVMTKNTAGTHYLFYRGDARIDEKVITAGEDVHLTGFLGIAKTVDGRINAYYENNYKGDVVGILKKSHNDDQYKLDMCNVYSPYGMVFHRGNKNVALSEQASQGFDGEFTDPATGWQFLGNGHRTYNPAMRYFVSEDPASGGYGFGSNNPIMNTDPSGDMPQWLGSAFKWFGYASSFGLGALHAKWANIAGAIITGGLTVATLGATAVTYGGALLGSAVIGATTAVSSVPVIAAAIPPNNGVNIAASVVGLAQTTVMMATAAADLGLFIGVPKIPTAITADSFEEIHAVNFKMLKIPKKMIDNTSQLVFKSEMNLDSFKVILPGIFVDKNNSQYLKINTFGDIKKIWSSFKREQNDLIMCDTACLLVAAKKGNRPLLMSDFSEFLKMKRLFSVVLERAEAGSYEPALPLLAESFTECFWNLLGKLNGDRQYKWCEIKGALSPIMSFDKIMTKPETMAILQTVGHVGVVERVSKGTWGIYNFSDNGELDVLYGTLEKIQGNFFSCTVPSVPREIYSYMMLDYWG